MQIKRLFTIGVYGWSKESFFNALQENGVHVVVDTRQRRGLRNRKFSFANFNSLAEELSRRGLYYVYVKELAPPPELRLIQKKADKLQKIKKTDRTMLSPEFQHAYETQVLDRFDLSCLTSRLPENINSIALLCVEHRPEACHRILAARHLSQILGAEVIHLLP